MRRLALVLAAVLVPFSRSTVSVDCDLALL